MALRIKLKNSVVQDRVPTTSDLPEVGELAVNANINSIGGFMRASDNSVVKIFGPGSLSTPTATTSVSGISELATNSETTTGTATNRVVTPAGLNAVTVAERSTSNSTYLALAGGTLTGVLAATAGSNSAPAINFGDSDSGIFGGTNTVSLAAGGTTRLTADTGVSVVGTLAVTGAISSTAAITGADFRSNSSATFFLTSGLDWRFRSTSGTERARIDSSGRLLVGTSTTRTTFAANPFLQVAGTDFDTSSCLLRRDEANSNPPGLIFGKSRGSAGGNTVVQENDKLGDIVFAGADGTDLTSQAAIIRAEVDGTPGANDMPGRLVFSTTADGAPSPTARMTINSSGQVGIGTLTPDVGNTAYKVVQVHSSSNNAYFKLSNDTTGSGSGDGVELSLSGSDGFLTNRESANLIFRTAATERMRIDSSGRVHIGTTTNRLGETLHVLGQGIITSSAEDTNMMLFGSFGSSTALIGAFNNIPVVFRQNNTERMRIDTTGRLQIGSTNNTATGTKLVVATGNNLEATALINTQDTDINALTLSNWDGSTTTNKVLIGFDNSGHGAFSLGMPAATNALAFFSSLDGASNERMRIDSSGRLLVGSSSVSNNGRIQGFIAHGSTAGESGIVSVDTTSMATGVGGEISFMAKTNTSGDYNYVGHVRGIKENSTSGNTACALTFHTRPTLTAPQERMRIDSSGTVRIANDSFTADTGADNLIVGSGFSGVNSGMTILNHSGQDGRICFGQPGDPDAGMIVYSHGNNHMQFNVESSERMRIGANGHVGLGTSSPNVSGFNTDARVLTISGPKRGVLELRGNTQAADSIGVIRFFSANNNEAEISSHADASFNGDLRFTTNGSQRMRIDSSGRFFFATTSQGAHGGFYNIDGSASSTNTLNVKGTTSNYVMVSSAGGGSGDHIFFGNYTSGSPSTNTGRIIDDGSNVTYHTTSDYRLKENVVTISDGISRVKQLNPIRHTWINNPTPGTVDGWLAHELDEVCPYAVDGEKDATNPDGSINPQGVDYGRITPLLTAALKEAIAKIETLEAKVAALEAA